MDQKRPTRRSFFYIWGSPLIKIGIEYLVMQLFVVGYMTVLLYEKYGQDTEALMSAAKNQELLLSFKDQVDVWLTSQSVYITGVAALITIPIIALVFYSDYKKEKASGIIAEKAAAWKYVLVLLMAAAMTLGLNNLILLSKIDKVSERYTQTITQAYSVPFFIQILILGILSPVCEELVFRGMIYKRLRYDLPMYMAMISSAMIFAVTHGNVVQGLYAFTMGMVFCYMYEQYGSLKAPVFAHVTANFLSIVGTKCQWFDWLFQEPIRVGIVTVGCATVASTAFVLMQRMRESEASYK